MRRQQRSRHQSSATLLLISLMALITASGCSKLMPTDPVSSVSLRQRSAVPATSTTSSYVWTVLASQFVNKTDDVTVSGGRYSVHFVRGSLNAGAQITIQQRDSLLADFVVGPNGTVCGSKPPTVAVRYAGTGVDPSVSGFIRAVYLWHLNESTGVWEQISGTNDANSKTFTAKIAILGRYALSCDSPGKGGW